MFIFDDTWTTERHVADRTAIHAAHVSKAFWGKGEKAWDSAMKKG
jgi:hypothetical protein